MPDDLTQRLREIESHLAHLERQYDELNEVVVAQARLIKKLQAQQQRAAETIEAAEGERIRSTSPKPPHYQ